MCHVCLTAKLPSGSYCRLLSQHVRHRLCAVLHLVLGADSGCWWKQPSAFWQDTKHFSILTLIKRVQKKFDITLFLLQWLSYRRDAWCTTANDVTYSRTSPTLTFLAQPSRTPPTTTVSLTHYILHSYLSFVYCACTIWFPLWYAQVDLYYFIRFRKTSDSNRSESSINTLLILLKQLPAAILTGYHVFVIYGLVCCSYLWCSSPSSVTSHVFESIRIK